MMDETSKPVKIGYFLDILSRRRWYIIIPFCVVMIIGIYFAITLPRIYSAETVLFFQPPEVPEDYVPSIHRTLIESKIDHITRQVSSRANLKKIIDQFLLPSQQGHGEIDIDNMIDNMISRIEVNLIWGDQTPDTFSITYEGGEFENPETVMQITNTLAAMFIEEALMDREEIAVDTSAFLEEEIQEKRKQLEVFEQKIKDFREKHMGGLPEQLNNNMRTIERLENRLNHKQELLLDAKNHLILLNNQLSEIRTLQQKIYMTGVDNDDLELNPFVRLLRLKLELEDLQSRYTPQHPDIIRLKLMVEELEQQIEAGAVELPESLKHNFSMEQLENINPMLAERQRSLLLQISALKLEIESLNAESAKILNDIATHEALVNETPLKEQELQILQRDYVNVRNSYNSLLERKMQAQLATNLEKKKKGEQFRIRSQAKLPHEPTEPNLKLIFLLTIFIALHLGAGLVFLLEYFDTSIREVRDLESNLKIPVLASIPKMYTVKDKVNYRINQILTYASMGFAFALCSAFALLVVKGVDGTMEMINGLLAHS